MGTYLQLPFCLLFRDIIGQLVELCNELCCVIESLWACCAIGCSDKNVRWGDRLWFMVASRLLVCWSSTWIGQLVVSWDTLGLHSVILLLVHNWVCSTGRRLDIMGSRWCVVGSWMIHIMQWQWVDAWVECCKKVWSGGTQHFCSGIVAMTCHWVKWYSIFCQSLVVVLVVV